MDAGLAVVFAGTPEFALPSLDAIAASRHRVRAVLTQPDRPSGRGRHVAASPVKERALELGLPVAQPASLKDGDAAREIAALAPDVMVVVAYGLLLPPSILALPRHGCLNVHASLLPRWRGAAPVARAILAGDAETGVTLMRMDEGLDTGPIVTAERLPLGPRETAGGLHDRLAELGARLVVDTIARLARDGALASRPQPTEGVTYAAKIERSDRAVDWESRAEAIDRKVRALSPAPGALAGWQGAQVRIVAVEPVDKALCAQAAAAGTSY